MNIELFWKIEICRKVLNTNDFRSSDDNDQMKIFSNYGIAVVSKDHLCNGGSDPGFHRLIIAKIFAENFMTLKKIGPRGEARP